MSDKDELKNQIELQYKDIVCKSRKLFDKIAELQAKTDCSKHEFETVNDEIEGHYLSTFCLLFWNSRTKEEIESNLTHVTEVMRSMISMYDTTFNEIKKSIFSGKELN